MRISTYHADGYCWNCSKQSNKRIELYLGVPSALFHFCRPCARKMMKGLLRELNKKEKK